jgi:hypothetical protein
VLSFLLIKVCGELGDTAILYIVIHYILIYNNFESSNLVFLVLNLYEHISQLLPQSGFVLSLEHSVCLCC